MTKLPNLKEEHLLSCTRMFNSDEWTLVGETPNPVTPTSKGPNVSMILGLNSVNIIHFETIVGRGRNPRNGQSPFHNLGVEAFSKIKNKVRRDSLATGANDLIQKFKE
ncbi:hypothetical protein RF11_05041 [Thelohanellus kitauei]|uniref:Uncharacterized protein n=1 Tax=Thelohanellus kitauei TaxID=669202 RepID=A0A0C2N1N5_THEKT|nr:hypothetical protein RF11_05041 [Thelohanellus kitauei]